MAQEKILFVSRDHYVDSRLRGAEDTIMVLDETGRLTLAPADVSSITFDDPNTKGSVTIIAFKEYAIQTADTCFYEGEPVKEIVGHIDVRHHKDGLLVQDPTFILESGREIKLTGPNFFVSPDDYPAIFEKNGPCIFDARPFAPPKEETTD